MPAWLRILSQRILPFIYRGSMNIKNIVILISTLWRCAKPLKHNGCGCFCGTHPVNELKLELVRGLRRSRTCDLKFCLFLLGTAKKQQSLSKSLEHIRVTRHILLAKSADPRVLCSLKKSKIVLKIRRYYDIQKLWSMDLEALLFAKCLVGNAFKEF